MKKPDFDRLITELWEEWGNNMTNMMKAEYKIQAIINIKDNNENIKKSKLSLKLYQLRDEKENCILENELIESSIDNIEGVKKMTSIFKKKNKHIDINEETQSEEYKDVTEDETEGETEDETEDEAEAEENKGE